MTPVQKAALTQKYDAVLKERLAKLAKIEIPLANGTFYRTPTLAQAGQIYARIVRLAARHLDEVGFKSVLVPASGGADSTFMLKILRDASDLNAANGKNAPRIIGITLPWHLQEEGEYLDDMGVWACELYAHDYATVNIAPAGLAALDALFNYDNITMASGKTLTELAEEINPDYPDREYRVDRGNIAARLRMMFSYGTAKRLGGAQCSTDNLSEGLEGFWTLCGDEGTFKYIQGIWKGLEQPSLMYIAGVPSPFYMQLETDGLGVGDGDCAQLYGSLFTGNETYMDVDTVLVRYLGGDEYPDPLNPEVKAGDHPVVRWHRGTDFKRNPFSLGRNDLGLTKIPGLTLAV
jgi:NH3-dependent NAD+ synthetase